MSELQARKPGYTTHNDLRLAFGVTTHTDPGPNFPFDYLFSLIKGAVGVDMYLIQISGNPSVWVSDGQTYRPIVNFPTMQKLQGIGVQTIVVSSQAELDDLGGALWEPPCSGSGGGLTEEDVDARIALSTIHPPA